MHETQDVNGKQNEQMEINLPKRFPKETVSKGLQDVIRVAKAAADSSEGQCEICPLTTSL